MAASATLVFGVVLLVLNAVFATAVRPVRPEKVFEAAFQGECREDSPCQHYCFDLHDGTFECACKVGYTLSNNGYGCIENDRLMDQKDLLNVSSHLNEDNSTRFNISDAGDLQIIDTFHTDGVKHYRPQALSYRNGHQNSISLELDSNHLDGPNGRPKDKLIDLLYYEHTNDQRQNGVPGRSLSSVAAVENKFIKTTPHPDLLSGDIFQPKNTVVVTTPSVQQTFRSCDELKCESGGICVPHPTLEGVRCRCPLGRTGVYCEQALQPRYPRFRQGSYLALPILRNAHKSLQLTLEFQPETNDGILLYSGEKLDLQGDFIAIVLNKGFVEFRFDCGMGEGLLRSDLPVVLHSWNILTIYRDRWDAWMQLNSGKQIQGRSKGLFSRITFRLNLYLAGSPNISLVSERTQSDRSFEGCVRSLLINRHVYNFKPLSRGDAVDGVDVDECSADVCSKMMCLNGGQCIATSPDHGACLCPLGYIGDQCEIASEVIVPSFNGSSYLQYPGLGNSVLSFIEVLIVFKPYRSNGVLFYNGYKMDGTGDFISVSLVNGFIEFRFDLGTGAAIIRSLEPVEMNRWHTVFISRTGRDGILKVDKQERVEGMSPGAFTQLSLPLNLYIGGVHDLYDISKKSGITASFSGCIQKVLINNRPLKMTEDALSGVNIANCKHPCVDKPCKNGGSCEPKLGFYTCHCLLGFAGSNCEKEVKEIIAEPMFSGASYLHYISEDIVKRIRGNKVDLKLRFRSFAPSGLLLWAGKKEMSAAGDYLSLGIKDGFLHLQYNLGSGETVTVYNNSRVDDGKWHTVRAIRVEQEASLVVDNGPIVTGVSPGPLNQLNINNGLYLGGMEDVTHLSMNKYHSGLVGCLANVTLSTDYHVRLITHATTGINIQPCL